MMKTNNSTRSKAAFAVSSSSTWLGSAATTMLLLLVVVVSWIPMVTDAQCIADDTIDAEFRTLLGVDAIPKAGSCCQPDVCGIPCPAALSGSKFGTFFLCASFFRFDEITHHMSVFLGPPLPHPPSMPSGGAGTGDSLPTLCR